jgi:hypothetical protein
VNALPDQQSMFTQAYNWCAEPFADSESIATLIHRHAWLSLEEKHTLLAGSTRYRLKFARPTGFCRSKCDRKLIKLIFIIFEPITFLLDPIEASKFLIPLQNPSKCHFAGQNDFADLVDIQEGGYRVPRPSMHFYHRFLSHS